MIRLITLMVILTNCSTTVDTRNKCPRVVLYNNSPLPLNKTDVDWAKRAPTLCKKRNNTLPCVSYMVKKGELNYHIQCTHMPRFDGIEPLIIKNRRQM
jgi:hypothetical protein